MKTGMSRTCLVVMCIHMSTGCATFFNGQMQDVIVNSAPSGATIWIDSVEAGKTPAILRLTRKDDHAIRLVRAGHADAIVNVASSTNSAWLANIFFLTLAPIGCALDFSWGGCYSLSPDELIVNLEKVENAQTQRLNIRPEELQKIKTVRFVHEGGRTELLLNVMWVD